MGTNPLGVIDRYYNDLNVTERQVADYIRANVMDVSRYSIDFVASEIGVSKSTLVRFSQKIGFTGYAQFKRELAAMLLSHESAEESAGQHTRAARRISDTYVTYLQRMADELDDFETDHLAELICESDRILIAGFDRGYHAPLQLFKRLMNVGIRSMATNELEALHNSFDLYTPQDLLLVFTVADGTKRFSTSVPTLKESGIKVACITCTQSLPFKKLCDSYIALPRVSRDPDVMFLDDQTLFFVFIEILIDAIAKRKAAKKES